MKPDAMVVVGYGQIIPQSDHRHSAARHHQRACVAAAEIPRRGADSVGHRQRRDAHGRDHHADRRGPGHRRHAAEMGNRNRTGRGRPRSSAARLAPRALNLLVETLRDNPAPVKQDRCGRHLCAHPEERGRADRLDRPAGKIFNRARGFLPWPGAYSFFRGQMFHIWKSRVFER